MKNVRFVCIIWYEFLVNLPSIFTIDQKIGKMFCKAFYVRYQNMYNVDYIGLATCSKLFWGFGNHVGNFFQSITQGSIRSIRLQSIHNEVYDWPNFFSRSLLRWNRSLMFSVKVDRKPLGQSEIWSIRVLWTNR